MNFAWSEDQITLYDRVRGFAQRLGAAPERTEPWFDRSRWNACADFGLTGMSIDDSHGGLGLDALTTARAFEAMGRGCSDGGLVFSIGAHLFASAMPIYEHGPPLLRQRIGARLSRGEWVGANAITEPGAGSDAFALSTTAVRDGDSYVLNGAKSFVTNGPEADVIVVYASTAPSHGYMGISAFAVERDSPGLEFGQPFTTMGLQSASIGPLYLDDCRVPAGNLLGAEGEGASIFKASMQWERSCLFAWYVGAMERHLERVIEYAGTRRQFRRPIGKHQAIAHRIADMKLRLEGARLLLYRACWSLDQGHPSTMDAALAKLAVSEAAIASSLDSIRIHGGLGVISEAGIESELRDAVPSIIFSGTSEIQRDLVARELGL